MAEVLVVARAARTVGVEVPATPSSMPACCRKSERHAARLRLPSAERAGRIRTSNRHYPAAREKSDAMTDLQRFGLALIGFAVAVSVCGALLGLVASWITKNRGSRR
jgi:hypothetical protein